MYQNMLPLYLHSMIFSELVNSSQFGHVQAFDPLIIIVLEDHGHYVNLWGKGLERISKQKTIETETKKCIV